VLKSAKVRRSILLAELFLAAPVTAGCSVSNLKDEPPPSASVPLLGMFDVRPNRPDEGQRIVSIWRAAVAATHEFLSPEDRKAIDAEAQAYLLSAALWVAADPHDQPVAFMGLSVARLEALFVDPQHRGKGIGRILVAFATSVHPVLDTEVNAQNEQALGFYRHLGFVETGYSPLDDQGRAYPLIRMRLLVHAGGMTKGSSAAPRSS
jgi:putative acetyltransferase